MAGPEGLGPNKVRVRIFANLFRDGQGDFGTSLLVTNSKGSAKLGKLGIKSGRGFSYAQMIHRRRVRKTRSTAKEGEQNYQTALEEFTADAGKLRELVSHRIPSYEACAEPSLVVTAQSFQKSPVNPMLAHILTSSSLGGRVKSSSILPEYVGLLSSTALSTVNVSPFNSGCLRNHSLKCCLELKKTMLFEQVFTMLSHHFAAGTLRKTTGLGGAEEVFPLFRSMLIASAQ